MVVERKVGQKRKEINLLGALREADHINLIGPARRQSTLIKIILPHIYTIILVVGITCIYYAQCKFFY